jgi:tRNA G18 (ribose-2'-O)-methylase SpoU
VSPEQVDDPADPRLADYVGLTDVVRRVRHEPAAGFFIAEGQTVMRRAALAGLTPRSLLLAPNRVDDLLPELAALDCPVYVASLSVLEAVTGFHVHRGALASFARPPERSADDLLDTAHRVLVLEGINQPTNLGAVFRSAAGLGMDAVLLSPTSCDPLYRRAVRVSMGEVFAVPYAYLTPWPDALKSLRAKGFRVLAMTPAADAGRLDEVVIGETDRVALLLGAEGPGLTEAAQDASDARVQIPMSAGVDSLNVAAAAAVGCWTVGRRPSSRSRRPTATCRAIAASGGCLPEIPSRPSSWCTAATGSRCTTCTSRTRSQPTCRLVATWSGTSTTERPTRLGPRRSPTSRRRTTSCSAAGTPT